MELMRPLRLGFAFDLSSLVMLVSEYRVFISRLDLCKTRAGFVCLIKTAFLSISSSFVLKLSCTKLKLIHAI